MEPYKDALDQIILSLKDQVFEDNSNELRRSLLAVFRTVIHEQRKAGVDVASPAYVEGLKKTIFQLVPPAVDQELLTTVLHLYLIGGSNSLITPYKLLAYNQLTTDDTDYNLVRRRSFFRDYSPDSLLGMINNTYELLLSDIERLGIEPEYSEIFFLIALSIKDELGIAICFARDSELIPGSLIGIEHPSAIEPVALSLISRKGRQENIKERAIWFFMKEQRLPVTEEIENLLKKWS